MEETFVKDGFSFVPPLDCIASESLEREKCKETGRIGWWSK